MRWWATSSLTASPRQVGGRLTAVTAVEPSHSSACLGGQRLFAWFPDCHGTLHTHHILQLEFGEPVAKFRVDPVSRIGQHNATVQVCRDSRTDLVECDRRLRLKLNFFGHFRLSPAFAI